MWHPNAHQFQMPPRSLGCALVQCFLIDLELRVVFRSKLCHTQLIAYITGKVFVRCLPAGFRVVYIGGRIL